MLWFVAHEKYETSRKRWGAFAAVRKKGTVQSFTRKDGETTLRVRASMHLLSTITVSSMYREMGIIITTCSSWSWKATQNRSLYTALSLFIALAVTQVSQRTEFGIENWKGKGFFAKENLTSLSHSPQNVPLIWGKYMCVCARVCMYIVHVYICVYIYILENKYLQRATFKYRSVLQIFERQQL